MAETSSEFDYLRDKHRQLREQNSPELNLRTHRSISWLSRASALVDDDPDAAFIFSWIAFNAAYAKDMGEDPGSFARTDFQKFFDALVRCDPKGWRVATVWECALRRPEETALAANLLAAWLRSSAAEIQIGNADVIADENAG